MVACALCRRFERWVFGHAWSDALDQTMRWGGYWNRDDLFWADINQDQIRELSSLWDTDPRAAFRGFLTLAEAGSVWSMERVGWAYAAGFGVSRDKRSAEHWFDVAFRHGSDYGLVWSAIMARSRGDLAKARETLAVGVQRALPTAMVVLGNLELKAAKTDDDRERVKTLYETAIAKGFLPAEGAYARAMSRGTFGWRKIPEGFRRYRRFVKAMSDAVEAKEKEISEATVQT